MKYFCSYTLGIKEKSNKAADKGTITHKVLELCAIAQKAQQDGISSIQDDVVGEVLTENYNPEYLASIISQVYQYYTQQFNHHKWYNKDYEDCATWVWKALKYNDGMFDPRNCDIVAAEPHFDFEIPHEWAKYNYLEHGLEGYLAVKGTIDLITDVGDNVYEICDYKTGQRKDWATGKIKDENTLYHDPQLRLYHYAAKHMFPDVHTFLVTIFFINHGGPYTVHFDDSDLSTTEEMIRKRFEHIRDTKEPKTIRQIRPEQSWICKRLCGHGKTTFEDTHIAPQTEKRPGQYTKYNETMSKCEQVRYMIKKNGIDWVIKNYTHPDHVRGEYGEGGGKVI